MEYSQLVLEKTQSSIKLWKLLFTGLLGIIGSNGLLPLLLGLVTLGFFSGITEPESLAIIIKLIRSSFQ